MASAAPCLLPQIKVVASSTSLNKLRGVQKNSPKRPAGKEQPCSSSSTCSGGSAKEGKCSRAGKAKRGQGQQWRVRRPTQSVTASR